MASISIIILVIGSLSYNIAKEYNTNNPEDQKDTGTPLFLTPYVESGQISEGRQLARVSFTESLLQIESYAGFFTVNQQYNSNHYFWYFPAMNPKTNSAPVIVWLSGGPGCSSLIGIFMENGPLRVINDTFFKMNYSLAQEYHVVYIESPVGAGFSFTNDSKGYCTDEIQIGEQLYSSVTQFFILFPELQKSEVFISGISYGGKYAPALAYTIHKKNQQAEMKINLKGMIIANGFSDPVNQLLYGEYLYQIGLIDWNQAKLFEEHQNKTTELMEKENWQEAITIFSKLLMLEVSTDIRNMTGFETYNNFMISNDSTLRIMKRDLITMLPKIRKSIHVGGLQFNLSSEVVRDYLMQDILKSVAPWVSEILDHYRVLIYNGQLDIIVPYSLTVNYLRKLNFSGAEEYKTAERHIWRVDGEVAGFKKKAGNLVEVLVRNAGHTAATDQPKWVLSLISDFINETVHNNDPVQKPHGFSESLPKGMMPEDGSR